MEEGSGIHMEPEPAFGFEDLPQVDQPTIDLDIAALMGDEPAAPPKARTHALFVKDEALKVEKKEETQALESLAEEFEALIFDQRCRQDGREQAKQVERQGDFYLSG